MARRGRATLSRRRVWILGTPGNETNLELVSRWRSRRIDVRLLPPGDASSCVDTGDVAIGRIDVRRSVDGLEPGLLALLGLAARGVRVVNRPAAILAAHDKLRTGRALLARGLPHPRTEHLLPGAAVQLAPPLVVKPRFGSWGEDVYRCLTDDDVARTVERLSARPWFRRQGAIVQELVPSSGYDVRVVVAAGRVAGADLRVARAGEWRTNVGAGATELPVRRLQSEASELAVAAVDALGGDLFGVDLLPAPGGLVVLEVNGAVEFDGIYSFPGRDVYDDVAAALRLPELGLRASEPAAIGGETP